VVEVAAFPEEIEPAVVTEPVHVPQPVAAGVAAAPARPRGLRFAEDLNVGPLVAPARPESGAKSNKKHKNKKGGDRDEVELEAAHAKKGKRGRVIEVEEEEFDEYQYLTKKR